MKLVKKTLHITLYSLYSGTPKVCFFIKEESQTAVFKILERTLKHDLMMGNTYHQQSRSFVLNQFMFLLFVEKCQRLLF